MVASSVLLKKGLTEAFKFLTNETDWLFTADVLKYSLALATELGLDFDKLDIKKIKALIFFASKTISSIGRASRLQRES